MVNQRLLRATMPILHSESFVGGITEPSRVMPAPRIVDQLGIKMLRFPAGEFTFLEHDGVLHREFRIAKSSFTMGQYKNLMNIKYDELKDVMKRFKSPEGYLNRWKYEDEEAFNEYPLAYIRHTEARKIAALAGMRLPTTLEWERAALTVPKWSFPYGPIFQIFHGYEWLGTKFGEIDFADPKNPVFPLKGPAYSTRCIIFDEPGKHGISRSALGPTEVGFFHTGFRVAEDIK